MSKNNEPISVVIPTRKIDDVYLKHVEKMFSHPKTEILVYENDGSEPLSKIYANQKDAQVTVKRFKKRYCCFYA